MAHGLILSDWKIPCTMKKKSILFVLAAICLPLAVSAQKEREITLNEAIAMARMQSVDAAVALNELKHLIGNIAHSVPIFFRKSI